MLSLHRKTPIKSIFGIALMSAALGLTACSAPLDPDVKARQDIMKDYGDAMGIIGDMVKAPDTFDAELLKDQTSFLAEASQNPWAHFENQKLLVMRPKPFGAIMQALSLSQRNSTRALS